MSRQPPDEPVVGESAYILFLVRRSLEDRFGEMSEAHRLHIHLPVRDECAVLLDIIDIIIYIYIHVAIWNMFVD